MFELNNKIAQGSVLIKSFKLSDLRLIRDGELTWFLLVPRLPNLKELTDLCLEDQQLFLTEVNFVMNKAIPNVDHYKVNIGSLGNVVSQFHFHIVFRLKTDRAWPGPIWGVPCDKEFNDAQATKWIEVFSE